MTVTLPEAKPKRRYGEKELTRLINDRLATERRDAADVGKYLRIAHNELFEQENGDQWRTWLSQFGLTPSAAYKYMSIAGNPVLAKACLDSRGNLPGAWTALYELSRVPPEPLEAAIETGQVRASMSRDEARALADATAGHAPRQDKGRSRGGETARLRARIERLEAELAESLTVAHPVPHEAVRPVSRDLALTVAVESGRVQQIAMALKELLEPEQVTELIGYLRNDE